MTVYTPGEDSYLLRDVIASLELAGKKALDMGTGSGILALEMAEKGAEVVAADINPEAIEQAENAAREKKLKLEAVQTDLFENIDGEFDLIVFNPPYLPGKKGVGDEEIWRGGKKGTELLDSFLSEVDGHLQSGGEVYVVLSSLSDYESLLDRYALEIVDREKLWFEELFVVRYK